MDARLHRRQVIWEARRSAAAVTAIALVALLLGAAAAAAGERVEQLANRDTARRLASSPLPPHTHQVAHSPKGVHLTGPPFEPVIAHLVDKHAVFVTKLAPPRAYAWLRSHPPPRVGARRTISRPTTGGRITAHIIGFHWGELKPLVDRELYETVVARPGGGGVFRIDSMAAWGTGEIAG